MKFIIPKLPQPIRIDSFLASHEPFLRAFHTPPSRSALASYIQSGCITQGNAPIKTHTLVKGGEIFDIDEHIFRPEKQEILPEPELPISVVFENSDILIVNKPAGIDTHPSTQKHTGTLVNWLIAHYSHLPNDGDPTRPGIVHRLDRDTSGLLIVAKTPEALQEFKQLFKTRQIQKTYLALVLGTPRESEGTINTPIARSPKGGKQAIYENKRATKGSVRPAETGYRVLETFGKTSLIEAQPKTGRTHQIRVHLASIGHPILGDALYGGKRIKASNIQPSHHLLHAARLIFSFQGQHYDFIAPLPHDFQETRQSLRNA